MNYKMISFILGWILIFEGMFLAVPGITALFSVNPRCGVTCCLSAYVC